MSLEQHYPAGLQDYGDQTLNIDQYGSIRISTGHRILHHDGKYSRPQGHNYEITVSITGALTEDGWVVDKGDTITVMDEWDYRFLLKAGNPLI